MNNLNNIYMKTSGLDVRKDSIFCAIYNGKSYISYFNYN
jgi:hypothetical protein